MFNCLIKIIIANFQYIYIEIEHFLQIEYDGS